MTNNTYAEIMQALRDASSIVMALHKSPDGDCTGSCIGVYNILKKMGKNVVVLSADDPPDFIDPILDLSVIEIVDPCEYDLSKTDTFLLMDTSELKLITKCDNFELPEHLNVINIDHHPENKNVGFADMNLWETDASSNCEILQRLFKANKIKHTTESANALLLGIITDTGFFRQSNTAKTTFVAVSELIEEGAKYFDITWELTFNKDFQNLKYEGLVLNNLNINNDINAVYSSITYKQLEDAGIDPELSQRKGSDMIKVAKGVDFAFFVKEKEDEDEQYFTVSLRSHKKDFSVLPLAHALGGGGHEPAAAAAIKTVDSIEQAIELVIEKAKEVY